MNIKFGQITTITGGPDNVGKRIKEISDKEIAIIHGTVSNNGEGKGVTLTKNDMIKYVESEMKQALEQDIKDVITGDLDPNKLDSEAQTDLIERANNSFILPLGKILKEDPIGHAKNVLAFVDKQNNQDASGNPFIIETVEKDPDSAGISITIKV